MSFVRQIKSLNLVKMHDFLLKISCAPYFLLEYGRNGTILKISLTYGFGNSAG